MITGRGHAPIERGGICTPSDGYRVLAANILRQAVAEIASGDIEAAEYGLASLLSRRAETYFALLGIDPGVAIKAVLKENGLELERNGDNSR